MRDGHLQEVEPTNLLGRCEEQRQMTIPWMGHPRRRTWLLHGQLTYIHNSEAA